MAGNRRAVAGSVVVLRASLRMKDVMSAQAQSLLKNCKLCAIAGAVVVPGAQKAINPPSAWRAVTRWVASVAAAASRLRASWLRAAAPSIACRSQAALVWSRVPRHHACLIAPAPLQGAPVPACAGRSTGSPHAARNPCLTPACQPVRGRAARVTPCPPHLPCLPSAPLWLPIF